VPAGIGFVRAWRFASWDRFALPWPGSTMVGVVGMSIAVPRDLDRGQLNHWVRMVEQELLRLTDLAEDWAERIQCHGRRAEPPKMDAEVRWRQSA
jgi:hypothetical protein